MRRLMSSPGWERSIFSGRGMQDTHPIAFLIPLAVGVAAVICTILIHALPLRATIDFVRREKRLGRVGVGFMLDTGIVTRSILYALVVRRADLAGAEPATRSVTSTNACWQHW